MVGQNTVVFGAVAGAAAVAAGYDMYRKAQLNKVGAIEFHRRPISIVIAIQQLMLVMSLPGQTGRCSKRRRNPVAKAA